MDPYEKYSDFTLQDFVTDPYFKEWVLQDDPEHAYFWERWMRENSEKSPILTEARDLVLFLESTQEEMDVDEFRELWEDIQLDIRKPHGLNLLKKSRKSFWPAAAAIAVVVSTVAAWVWWAEPGAVEYTTAYGETREITLPDSSTVILNANSQLTFKDNWKKSREISITGEAFFRVVHKVDDQPFKVTTSQGVTVEVLGTEFNVYHRSEETEVVLSSGAVTLSFPMEEREGKILMEPGELVEFKEKKFQRKKVDPEHYVSWTGKVLNLDHTSLSQILKMARENYGVRIKVADERILNQTASGSMPLEGEESFMNQVSKIFNIEIKYHDSIYHIN